MAEPASTEMQAAFDAAAETPVVQIEPKKVKPLFHMEQSKKDIMYALITVIIVFLCLNYIPYEVSDEFRLFMYIVLLGLPSAALGYTVAKYRENKKMQQKDSPK